MNTEQDGLTATGLGDNWKETRRAGRRMRAAWRGLWAQVFLGWALRCDEQAVIDFLWDEIEEEIARRHKRLAAAKEASAQGHADGLAAG